MYDGLKHTCIEDNHILNIFSFSKAYGMMGWRVGYVSRVSIIYVLNILHFYSQKALTRKPVTLEIYFNGGIKIVNVG